MISGGPWDGAERLLPKRTLHSNTDISGSTLSFRMRISVKRARVGASRKSQEVTYAKFVRALS